MDTSKILKTALTALEDLKAGNVISINVSKVSSVTDYMVIASGTSSQHVKSIANNLRVDAKQAGIAILGFEGEANGEWILADLGDVVVHIMQPEVREYYQLEKLWA